MCRIPVGLVENSLWFDLPEHNRLYKACLIKQVFFFFVLLFFMMRKGHANVVHCIVDVCTLTLPTRLPVIASAFPRSTHTTMSASS